MAERQIVIRRADGKWSAAYSDRPEELFHGITMQDAIDRLQSARGTINEQGQREEGSPKPPPSQAG